MTRHRVILDCDPGHDDAIALVMAARHTDLVGVTTVSGNAPIESTTTNAQIVIDLLGLDLEVHPGAPRPLVVEPFHADYVHGESGLDGADLPPPSRPPSDTDAVSFLIETCRAEEGLWIVATGPLTNVATALRAAPDLARRIAGISVMGGGRFGNRTAAAEFNIWCDPHAAAIVFGYGGPLVMAGLHLTHQFQATPARIDRVRALPGRLAGLLADLLVFFSHTYVSRHEGMEGAAVHDPCAVLALTHPELFTTTETHVEIETESSLTRGLTLIDDRLLLERGAANTTVLETIDAERAFDLVVEAIGHYSAP